MTATEFHYKLITNMDSLMRYARRLTADTDDAKDLVQETCLKALNNSDKFADESNFRAWTFTILKNTFINNYHSSSRYNTVGDRVTNGFLMNSIRASCSYNPDTIYTSKEIENLIEKLDEPYKLPFKMRHQGFKYKEISEKLNLKLGTVKSRIFISRKTLIKQLEQ